MVERHHCMSPSRRRRLRLVRGRPRRRRRCPRRRCPLRRVQLELRCRPDIIACDLIALPLVYNGNKPAIDQDAVRRGLYRLVRNIMHGGDKAVSRIAPGIAQRSHPDQVIVDALVYAARQQDIAVCQSAQLGRHRNEVAQHAAHAGERGAGAGHQTVAQIMRDRRPVGVRNPMQIDRRLAKQAALLGKDDVSGQWRFERIGLKDDVAQIGNHDVGIARAVTGEEIQIAEVAA